ncbi:MAG: hypothetical protein GY812_15065 [Actinomycetia bacterium]|nr:hypothetical protein [Actinomycetes bacterium]
MDNEHASRGTEHLQQAARELIGAARSFLDAAEEMVEDSEFVDDAAQALRTVVADLGSVARPRPANGAAPPGEDMTGADDPGEDGAETAPNSTSGATEGADKATRSDNEASSTRVRRIDVE